MCVAAIANHFRSFDEQTAIILFADDFVVDRSEKGGPTGSGVKFCLGIEQLDIAANAPEFARVLWEIIVCKRSLRGTFPSDAEC